MPIATGKKPRKVTDGRKVTEPGATLSAEELRKVDAY